MEVKSHNVGARAASGTQAVDRAASLVALVVQADDPVTFSELTEETGLARSTTSRLLAALERTRLLERDDSGAYVAGPLFALHAASHDPWPQVVRLATPILATVRDHTGETVHLGVPRGDNVGHIAQVDSTYLLGSRDWTDVIVPAHCSSLGKVLYAYDALALPDEPLERRTGRTVTKLDELLTQLAVVRRQGYAVTIDELEVGLTALAAPVHTGPPTAPGPVIAALGVSGPTARLQDRVGQVGRLLIEQAGRLSDLLRRTHEEGAA
ncbi:MAG: IclR family transcriptional regulator [Nocardioidaceae bacterium]